MTTRFVYTGRLFLDGMLALDRTLKDLGCPEGYVDFGITDAVVEGPEGETFDLALIKLEEALNKLMIPFKII